VVAYNDKGTSDDPYLIRTFETYPPRGPGGPIKQARVIRNAGPPQDIDIPLVGRATTSAPGYFRHLTARIGDTTFRFKDGGFGCNNPSWETYKDVAALLPNGGGDLGPFISIGTGNSDVPHRSRLAELTAATKGLSSRTEGTHENMVAIAYRDGKERFHYSRFDGGYSLGAISIDEWEPNDLSGIGFFTGKHKHSGRDTLRKIEVAITQYLAQEEVQKELDQCAKILVQRRRRQTRDQSRWDRFASASFYICQYNKCKERRYNTLENYKRHVLQDHHQEASLKQLDKDAQLARRCWLYRS
jgi:hypothetical protein